MSWRRILLLSIALVTVLGIVTWTLLQHSDVATELVKKQLAELFRSRTEVASTRVELAAGRLTIAGFELADPTDPERNLVRIDQVHLDVQANPLGGRFEPRLVVAEGLQIECGPTWPTVAQLLTAPPSSAPASDGLPVLPVIEVRSGKATIHLRTDEPPLVLEQLELTAVPVPESPNILQIRGNATLLMPEARLTVQGEFDLTTGAGQLGLSTGDVTCSQDVVGMLARMAKVDKQGLDVGGQIHSLELLCKIPANTAADRRPTFEISAECDDVHLDAPDLPAIVKHAKVSLYANTADRGTIRARVEQNDEEGAIEVTTAVTDLMPSATATPTADRPPDSGPTIEVHAAGRDVIVNKDVLAALRSFAVGRQIVDALQPSSGRAEIDLYLRNHDGKSLTELDLVMRGVAMTFQGFGALERRIGFPLPLVEASGNVRLRGDVLLLQDMSAEITPSAGGGKVTLEGRIDINRPSGEDTTLDIHAGDVAFSSDLRHALSTLLRDNGELYDKLAPSGRAKVEVLVRPASELAGSFRVEIQPSGAAMQWAGFPYRLDELRGDITVLDAGVDFDLTGRHGDGSVTMRGRIPLRAEHLVGEGFEAVADIEKLTIDDDLRQAVAVVVPELETAWQKAAPSGTLSGQVKVWRPQPDDPLLHDVRLELLGVDLKLPIAPWRATDLAGQVLVQGSGSAARIDFDALRGKLENGRERSAQLALLGHVESGPTPRRDLAFVVRDLELCERLGKSLEDLGALDFSTWTSLQPSGSVDLVCRELFDGRDESDLQVIVQLVDVRSEAPMLPKPAERMTGELRIQDGELTFRDVRGVLGGAAVRCWDGRVRQLPAPDGRTSISFAVHAKDFPVDDGLANLFSGPLRDAVRERQLRGQADVDGLRLEFRVPQAGSKLPFATTIQGQLGLDGVDMLLGTGDDGIRVLDLRGVVALAESTVSDAGGALTGTLRNGSLSLFGHSVDAIEAQFTADAERLLLDTLTSRLHDGQLVHARTDAPALTYLLPSTGAPEGRLAADLTFERVDVFSLLTASGWSNPPYSGSASGRMTLRRLDGNNVVSAEAEGNLLIERADLGKVPLFTAIYAQLPAADRPRFNYLDLSYRLTGQRVNFEKLEVRSDLLAAIGAGSLDLDGYLDVRMELDNLLGTSADPLVMPLIDYLAKNLVRFHLFGHLRDLRAEQRWVTESSPGRRAILPMPPERPKPRSPGF